jgi:hypothetical protein
MAVENTSYIVVSTVLVVLVLIGIFPWLGVATAALVVGLWLAGRPCSNNPTDTPILSNHHTILSNHHTLHNKDTPPSPMPSTQQVNTSSTPSAAPPRSVFARPNIENSIAEAAVLGITPDAPLPNFMPVPDGCPDMVDLVDVEPRAPEPANLVLGQNVLADEPFAHPGLVDRMCEQQWFPSGPLGTSENDRQRNLYALHRAVRRDEQNAGAETAAIRAKRENARSRQETAIASALRPDPYSIVEGREGDAEPGRPINSQPFASLGIDHNLAHSHTFRRHALGMGDMANALKSTF